MIRTLLFVLATLATAAWFVEDASAQVVVYSPVVTTPAVTTYSPVVTTYSPVVTAAPTVVYSPPVVTYSPVLPAPAVNELVNRKLASIVPPD